MELLFFYFLGALSVVGVWLIFAGLGDLKKSKIVRDASQEKTTRSDRFEPTPVDQTNTPSMPLSNEGISVIAITLLVGAVAGFIYLLMPNGNVSTASAEQDCVRWFKRNRDLGGDDAFVSSSWEKDGKIVVKVGFDTNGDEYSTRLCVYDPETGDMSAPNNLTRSRWE